MLQAGSKRRRTKAQIQEEKEAAFIKEQQVAAKLASYDALQQKVSMMEEQRANGNAAASLVQQFVEAGFVQ